eukprot:TRINITY_DN27612_c0_g1_i2.p1 TRINITY_DN27612_c0_g1~~TRINITY_DN27612_c0_g1_i2.p1  ORF type:complete len:209 (-),score=29.79 TRINITY_DN27612_c0_g1_i2:85-711(-)
MRRIIIYMLVSCMFVFFFNVTATTEIYTLHIVGSVRCVQETDQSPPVFSLPGDTIICENERLIIDIPQGNYSILWEDNSAVNHRVIEKEGNYSVAINNQCGNISDAFQLGYKNCYCYIYFPNAFTPVGDGLNDCFSPVYNCEFLNYHFIIFNRWGQQIFETSNPTICWDGKYLNKEVEPGVYVWVVTYSSLYYKGCLLYTSPSPRDQA